MAKYKQLEKLVRSLLDEFQANRDRTLEVLEALDDGLLHRQWPRHGLDTFAKHMLEVAAIQRAFALSIRKGVLDFSEIPDTFDFPVSATREEIRAACESADRELQEALERAAPEAPMDWGEAESLALEQHLLHLVSHEVFHHGTMVMMLYSFGVDLPENMKQTWTLPEAR